MKTDSIFYQLFQEFPQIFFELIKAQEISPDTYQFISPEIKQLAFRLDGVFVPLEGFSSQPLYFVEIQFYKDEEFYARLFSEVFLYFKQYNPSSPNWYAIVIYASRSNESPISRKGVFFSFLDQYCRIVRDCSECSSMLITTDIQY